MGGRLPRYNACTGEVRGMGLEQPRGVHQPRTGSSCLVAAATTAQAALLLHAHAMGYEWEPRPPKRFQTGKGGQGSKPGEGDLEVLLEKVHARDSCDDLERGAEEKGPVSGEALLEKREVRNMGERLDFEPPLTTAVESLSTVRQAQPTRESHGRSPRL